MDKKVISKLADNKLGKYPTPINHSYLRISFLGRQQTSFMSPKIGNFRVCFMSQPQLITIYKRNMLSWSRNMLFRGRVLKPTMPIKIPGDVTIKRDFATWQTVVRIHPPLFLSPRPPLKLDPELKMLLLPYIDFSGKNHRILVDLDFKHPLYLKVHGVFTTKLTPFEGKPPRFVSPYTLDGIKIPQYFHEYTEPALIEKKHVALLSIESLTKEEIIVFLNTIKT